MDFGTINCASAKQDLGQFNGRTLSTTQDSLSTTRHTLSTLRGGLSTTQSTLSTTQQINIKNLLKTLHFNTLKI